MLSDCLNICGRGVISCKKVVIKVDDDVLILRLFCGGNPMFITEGGDSVSVFPF